MIIANCNRSHKLKNNKKTKYSENIRNFIFESFKTEIFNKPEELLLNLIFAKEITQNDLDEFLEKWDIEVMGGHKAILLSYFMKTHPDLKFSDYFAPRLNGLIQYYRFQNLKLIAHYKKICTELKKAGIDFIIFKGGCIKYLRPEFPRVMGDIDILVSEKDFKTTQRIAENMGYDVCCDIHSIDLHQSGSEEGIMDIHKYIILQSDKEKAFLPDLFNRATKQVVFGVETLVPSNEDLVFIILVNLVRNLINKTSSEGIPQTLFDCKYLIESKPDFDWNIVFRNSEKTDTKNQMYFAVKFINSIVPDLLPEKANFCEKFDKYCILLIYQRFFLWEMKQKHHTMKIKDLFSSMEFFKEYLKLKPKYFILKLGIIRKNPVLAEIILKKAGFLYEN